MIGREPRVKKLQWSDPVGPGEVSTAPAPFGHYLVVKENGWWAAYNAKDGTFIAIHKDRRDSIDAAQDDFESRILSCLEP